VPVHPGSGARPPRRRLPGLQCWDLPAVIREHSLCGLRGRYVFYCHWDHIVQLGPGGCGSSLVCYLPVVWLWDVLHSSPGCEQRHL
jgi:hypothetical protein